MRKTLLSLAVVLMLLACPALAAAPLANKLPAKSLVYVGWTGRNQAFDTSMLGQLLLQEPIVANTLQAVYKGAAENVGDTKEKKAFEHAWQMGRIAWHRPVAFSLVDIKSTRKGPKPQIAVLIDLGDKRQEFAGHLDAMLKVAEAPVSDNEGELDYRIVSSPAGLIGFGYLGNVFFLTVGENMPKMIKAVTPATSLAADRPFTTALATVDGPAVQMVSYGDVQALITTAEKAMAPPPRPARPGQTQPTKPADTQPSQVQKIVKALGFGKTTAVVSTVRVVNKAMYSKTRLLSPAPHTGLLRVVTGPVLTDQDLAGIPADADFAAAANISLQDVWREVIKMARSISPNDVPEPKKIKEQIRESLGLSIEDDILVHLGNTWVVSSAESHGGFLTGTLFTGEVKDAEALDNAVNRLKNRFAPPPASQPATDESPARARRRHRRQRGKPTIRSLKVGEAIVHYTAAPGLPVPVAPAWAIHGGKFYFAMYPQVLATALRRTPTPITADPDYRKVRQFITGQPTILAYSNTPKVARRLYPLLLALWTTGANAAGKAGIDLRPEWMPSMAGIEKYLSPEISGVSHDAAGVTFESYATLPMMPSISDLVGLVGNLGGVGVTQIGRSLGEAKKSGTQANLKSIGAAMMEYRRANNAFPKRPGDLVKGGYLPAAVFKSPFSDGPAPTFEAGRLVGNISYVFIEYPDPMNATRPNAMWAYDKAALDKGKGTAVLTLAGNVTWTTPGGYDYYLRDAQREIARQKAKKAAEAVKKALEEKAPE